LECLDREKAEVFFTKILKIPRVKSFTVSEHLSERIFGIARVVEVDVYDKAGVRFEIFFPPSCGKIGYGHVCVEVDDKEEFMERCKRHGVEPLMLKEEGKDLLFVRDFSGNLYEIKEK
jgi:catechol 2,3-dioxygenase-like lactoylglutathione lyase family enzyme